MDTVKFERVMFRHWKWLRYEGFGVDKAWVKNKSQSSGISLTMYVP